jgi:hypothetical protein
MTVSWAALMVLSGVLGWFTLIVPGIILPRRFAIVIGENGVGKSQTLGNIAKAALEGSKGLTDAAGDRPYSFLSTGTLSQAG